MGRESGQWPIDGLGARLLKRIVCFHSDVDIGVTTHLLEVVVNLLHLLHHVVRNAGLSEEHIQLTRHTPRHRVDAEAHLG